MIKLDRMLTKDMIIEICDLMKSGTCEIKDDTDKPIISIIIDSIQCTDEVMLMRDWSLFDELMCKLQSESLSFEEDCTCGEYEFEDCIIEVEMR